MNSIKQASLKVYIGQGKHCNKIRILSSLELHYLVKTTSPKWAVSISKIEVLTIN